MINKIQADSQVSAKNNYRSQVNFEGIKLYTCARSTKEGAKNTYKWFLNKKSTATLIKDNPYIWETKAGEHIIPVIKDNHIEYKLKSVDGKDSFVRINDNTQMALIYNKNKTESTPKSEELFLMDLFQKECKGRDMLKKIENEPNAYLTNDGNKIKRGVDAEGNPFIIYEPEIKSAAGRFLEITEDGLTDVGTIIFQALNALLKAGK